MATFRLSHFSVPETLQTIDRDRLLTFLEPYRAFFLSRSVSLPSVTSADPIPFDRLVDVFMSPDELTPQDLIDALYYVDAMSTPVAMDSLLDAVKEVGLSLDVGDDVTPADVAVRVWLLNSDLLERKQAEQYLSHPRSFEYYQTDETGLTPVPIPAPKTIVALEQMLDDEFVERKRGRTARVFSFHRAEGWFLVRHGEPFKREESIKDAQPSSVGYRPLKYDVVIYDPRLSELRVNAQSKWERELYRQAFGQHLFGRGDFFPDRVKYTLEPLRKAGEASLVCLDVEGMEWVRLREVHYSWNGKHGEYEILKASDVFAALRDRGNRSIPSFPKLAKAVFQVKFRDAKRPRSVTVKPPNTALYVRDTDSTRIEEWLHRREFLNVYPEADDLPPDSLLASA